MMAGGRVEGFLASAALVGEAAQQRLAAVVVEERFDQRDGGRQKRAQGGVFRVGAEIGDEALGALVDIVPELVEHLVGPGRSAKGPIVGFTAATIALRLLAGPNIVRASR